jgi:hypothetical protein
VREHGRKHIVARTFSMATTVDPSSLVVRGEYSIVGGTVNVTITDKHWLVLWRVVEMQGRR